MPLPEKDYFTFEELAKRWEAPVDLVEHYVERGMLKVHVKLPKGRYRFYASNHWRDGIKLQDTEYFEASGLVELQDYGNIVWTQNGTDTGFIEVESIEEKSGFAYRMPAIRLYEEDEGYYFPCRKLTIYKSRLVVLWEEQHQFELRHGLAGAGASLNITKNGIPGYLDPEHPGFSQELCAAVKTWLALFGPEWNVHLYEKGIKEQIVAWVRDKYSSDLDPGAPERIATVINPNKHGGGYKKIFEKLRETYPPEESAS